MNTPELFSDPDKDPVLTVSELTAGIKELLEASFPSRAAASP